MSATPQTGTCRGCGASLLWARMPSGRLNPLNAEPVDAAVGKGVTAFNSRTGKGMPVTLATIDDCPAWAQAGVTFHTSHFSSCVERERFRREAPAEAT